MNARGDFSYDVSMPLQAGRGLAAGEGGGFTVPWGVYFIIAMVFWALVGAIAYHYVYRRLKRTQPDLWRRVFGMDGKNPDIVPYRDSFERYMWWRRAEVRALIENQPDIRLKYAHAAARVSTVAYFVTFFLTFVAFSAGPALLAAFWSL